MRQTFNQCVIFHMPETLTVAQLTEIDLILSLYKAPPSLSSCSGIQISTKRIIMINDNYVVVCTTSTTSIIMFCGCCSTV